MGQLLNRETLLARDKFDIEQVKFEDGDFVYVRQFSAQERDTFERSLMKEKKDDKGVIVGYEQDMTNFRSKLAALVLCDEKGVNLLRPNDYAVLAQNITAKKMELIIEVAQRLNKITPEAKEEAVKNSDPGQVDNSNSDSAGN